MAKMRTPLLIFHAIGDEIVGIEHARRIYDSARGPRSFLSLDGADHLLSRPEDSEYVAETMAAWASRYLDIPAATPPPVSVQLGEVRVVERAPGLLNDVYDGRHHLMADEPESVGGTDQGPNPYEYLLASLGACTSMTLRLYANRKGWPVDRIGVRLRHQKIHAKDCEHCETQEGRLDRIETTVEIEGDLDDTQRQRMLEIAHRCPVHRTLKGEIDIPTRLS